MIKNRIVRIRTSPNEKDIQNKKGLIIFARDCRVKSKGLILGSNACSFDMLFVTVINFLLTCIENNLLFSLYYMAQARLIFIPRPCGCM